jgi:RNA polymerase sigma-70 factor, ECF subfamily
LDDLDGLYEEYSIIIYAFLMRLCNNRDLAEELAQETFYQALRGRKQYNGDSSVATWLCGIAKRLYWSALRKKPPIPCESAQEQSASDFTEQLISIDRAMEAQHLLHHLAEPYREVFTLRTFCDLQHSQIGELFGKSENWARVTYYRARHVLAEQMKESEKNEI